LKLLVLLLFVIFIIHRLSNGHRFSDEEGECKRPLIALVFLLDKPRSLTAAIIARAATRAFGTVFEPDVKSGDNFVVQVPAPVLDGLKEGVASSYFVAKEAERYVVNVIARPYVEDPEGFADGFVELRTREAVARHKAWISVDSIGGVVGQDGRRTAYRDIGLLLSELAGPDCRAVFCPELGLCNAYDEKLQEQLRSEEPLSIFDDFTFAPILSVDSNDPRMLAAVAEARRRWPEFVAAFEARTESRPEFLVKAEFREGEHSEFMWIEVAAISDEGITGILQNNPNVVSSVVEGQNVTVPHSDLNDWIISGGEELVGGFTLDAISKIYE